MRDRIRHAVFIVAAGVALMTLLVAMQDHVTGTNDTVIADGSQRAFTTMYPGLADLSPAQMDRYIEAQRAQGIGSLP